MSGMWERALEAAADARTLTAAGRVNAAANRAYYTKQRKDRLLENVGVPEFSVRRDAPKISGILTVQHVAETCLSRRGDDPGYLDQRMALTKFRDTDERGAVIHFAVWYYSVFCVARAASRFVHQDLDQSKTLAGVIRLFGLEIVVKSGLDPDLGEILSKAEDVRRLADFSDDGVSLRQSQEAVTKMEKFLSAIAAFIGKCDSLPLDQNTP